MTRPVTGSSVTSARSTAPERAALEGDDGGCPIMRSRAARKRYVSLLLDGRQERLRQEAAVLKRVNQAAVLKIPHGASSLLRPRR